MAKRINWKNWKKCNNCRGTGNLDDIVGFTLDCLNCGGTGWIRKNG